MTSSMSLEEKFEAPMKSYKFVSTSNQDLQRSLEESKGQNVYLRKQVDKPVKPK